MAWEYWQVVMTGEILDRRHKEISSDLTVLRQRAFGGEMGVTVFQEHTEFWGPFFILTISYWRLGNGCFYRP